ncbi:dihydrouridine synthase [Diplocarpon rosae]|nr:dihydrouridine synthase [Diplocarpon rosae]
MAPTPELQGAHACAVLETRPHFTLSTSPTPTIAQLGVNSPLEIYRSTLMLAPYVNGIDINCGCPQSWACAETLGAALMHHPELVCQMIDSAKSALLSLGLQHQKSISVKIRIHSNIQQTLDFVQRVEDAGVDFITVHGRTRRTPSSQPVNLDAIRRVKVQARVPVLGNGDVFTRADVDRINWGRETPIGSNVQRYSSQFHRPFSLPTAPA